MSKYSGIVFLSIMLFAASASSAGEPVDSETQSTVTLAIPAPARSAIPSSLQHYLLKHDGKVLETFDAGGGLAGWYLTSDFGNEILYTTADGSRLIDGQLLDPLGRDLREQQLQPRKFARIIDGLGEATGVVLGNGAFKMYMVYEPHCTYCHKLVQSLIRNAGVELHLIPIAFLDEDSEQLSAALLAAKDPAAVLRTLRIDPDAQSLRTSEPQPEMVSAVQRNTKLIKALDIDGTPFLAWRDDRGQAHVKSGLPSDEQLARILRSGGAAMVATSSRRRAKTR
jgi:thiol:disulfide interchange protein DsbG